METMKISDVIVGLLSVMSKYGDLDCYYSRDDEGNGFQLVGCDAGLMKKWKNGNRYSAELLTEEDVIELGYNMNDYESVCVIN